MNLVKLSLVAALAAGSFSALNAKSLEEAIKNVDISGWMQYRYDSARFTNGSDFNLNGAGIATTQTHRYKAVLTTKIDAGDGFKLVGQLLYGNDKNGGFDTGTATKEPIKLKQAYLQYDLADAGVSFLLGRQNLNTIWTDDLAGMAAKVLVTPTDGLTIAAFAVDSFDGGQHKEIKENNVVIAKENTLGGDDEANFHYVGYGTNPDQANALNTRLYKENMYGAAVLGDFGPLKAELWGNYWDKTATLYAVKLDFLVPFGGGDSFRIHANYLGNVIHGNLQNDVRAVMNAADDLLANGNLANLKAEVKVSGFDANIGGIYFGNKDKITINTLEEPFGGDGDMYVGSEIFYQKGSWAVLSKGQSTYGYFGAGYTLPADIRFGIKGVYGETKMSAANQAEKVTNAKMGAGEKIEGLAEISWQVNKGLKLLTYYSYLHTQAKDGMAEGADAVSIKNTVRFQARYSF